MLLRPGNVEERVPLSGIDCPERGQVFGTRAKEVLADQVLGAVVSGKWNKRDRYERVVGRVTRDGKDVGDPDLV